MKKLTAVVVGAGNRSDKYSCHSLDFPDELQIVGVVDPDITRVNLFKEKFSISEENCYCSPEEFLKRDKFADFVINGTKGEIKGTFEDQKYVIRTKNPSIPKETGTDGYTEKLIDLKVQGDMIGQKGGHGGGDENLMKDLMHYLNGETPSVSCTTLKDSTISHHTVFMAEKSRKEGKIINL